MTDNKVPMKTITLAYFSGTGCTKAIVDCFEKQLIELGIQVTKINIASCNAYSPAASETLIIFSPVYALRLVSMVENWVKTLPIAHNTSAAIISISGAGEISPNTACRVRCKRLLKRKGYALQYEKMLVMPSNFLIQADQQLNLNLINIMPHKVKQIITEMLSGKKQLTAPHLQDRFLASLGKAEHLGAKFFGWFLHASKACNQCGICIRNCPTKNIRMKNGKPKFGFACLWCLKCIYTCPCKALTPRLLKFTILKNGFDLQAMSELAQQNQTKLEFIPTRSILWQGVINYINEE